MELSPVPRGLAAGMIIACGLHRTIYRTEGGIRIVAVFAQGLDPGNGVGDLVEVHRCLAWRAIARIVTAVAFANRARREQHGKDHHRPARAHENEPGPRPGRKHNPVLINAYHTVQL